MRPRRPPARAAALLLVVLVASGCAPGPGPTPGTTVAAPTATASSPATPTPGPSPSEAVAPPTRWTDCGKGFLCASLRVPKDYDDPGKGTLSVALVRLPATEPKDRVGALVVNPGGPGGSGVDFVRESSDQFPSELRKRFDLVGFDPRGVNTSSAVRCIDNLDGHADLDPSPDSAAELSALADAARSYAAACERRNPDLLPYLSTEAVVRDLDLIRQAVGDDLLTYAGFSYGTLIGSLYAERFPTHVR
ncbi:MAG: alpha/beta fold hydrolase, partial [Chloroflexota bacterium]